MKLRPLRMDEVEVTVEILPEDVDYRGSMASGDDAVDHEVEEWIAKELRAGNQAAWCILKVTASWRGWKGVDCLGCCSYSCEEDARAAALDEYGMPENALRELNDGIMTSAFALGNLEVSS